MFKLGIIGTGSISHEFIKAAHSTGDYQLAAVYSRTLTSAERFVQNYENTAVYTEMLDFLSSDIDVVYIASPNSLHFNHAKVAILARKHALSKSLRFLVPKNGGNWSSWLTSTKSISLKLPATIMSRPLIRSVIFSRTRPSWEPTSPMPSILQKCKLCLRESSPTFSQLSFLAAL